MMSEMEVDDIVRAETERCAELCEKLAQKFHEESEPYMRLGALECADAIRRRNDD